LADVLTGCRHACTRKEGVMNTLIKSEFPLLRRFPREIDWFFNRFDLNPFVYGAEGLWSPNIEIFEKENEFVVHAEVPGLKKEDLTIEVTEYELTIKGERRNLTKGKEEGYYKTERSYGAFTRTIPLPEGVKVDAAKAVVRDGILEVTMPLLKAAPYVKRLEITEPPAEGKASKHAA
jgi:HSP20 family protein